MSPHRLRRTLALFAVAATMLAGCAAIPGAGPVNEGQALEFETDQGVSFQPEGPADDASPNEIVRGFLSAASNSQGDYAVARQFLAPEASRTWQPGTGVRVITNLGIERLEGARVRATARLSAEVDGEGVYREAPPGRDISLEFELIQVGDQWRIAELPDGISLERTTFDLAFAGFPVYFYDPSFSRLVPDLRWFPSDAATATRIVRAALSGPSRWLADGALVSAIPESAELSVAAVTVTAGVARVDLTSMPPSDRQRSLMLTQLQASLAGVGSIREVTLSIEQEELDVSPATGIIRDGGLPASPMVQIGTEFGPLVGGEVNQPAVGSTALVGLGGDAADMHVRSERLAVRNEQGVWLVEGRNLPVLVDERDRQVAPTLDERFVWTASSQSATVHVWSRGVQTAVQVPWLPSAARLRALSLAHDGTRIAIAWRLDGTDHVAVAGIIRNESNTPIRLGEPLELNPAAGEFVGVVWAGSEHVLSAWQDGPDTRVKQHQLGGRDEVLVTTTMTLRTIVAGSTPTSPRALDRDGGLWELRLRSWTQIASDVSLLVPAR